MKRNQQVLDYWITDVYGNQYGLFKELSGVPVVERKNIFGELWTRTNDQIVLPASTSLSAVFQNMSDERQKQTLYSELTSVGIKSIDCFFDTLMIETSSTLSFAQVDYDFESAIIESPIDSVKGITLSDKLRYEQTWFLADVKKTIVLLTKIDLENNSFVPEFHQLDLETHTLQKIFPETAEQELTFNNALSGFSFETLSRGLLHYDPTTLKYLITYSGLTNDSKPYVINIIINAYENYSVEKINVYVDEPTNVFGAPPIFVSPRFITIGNTMQFSLQGVALNDPTMWETISFTQFASATNTGIVFGQFPNIGVYDLNINLTNKYGSTKDSITVNVVDSSMLPTPMPTPTMAPPTPTPEPTSTQPPTPTPSSSPGPTPTPSNTSPTPTPSQTAGLWCVAPGESPATVNILNVYSSATPPESNHFRQKACYRCVTLTVNANGDITTVTQSGSTTSGLNLGNILINNSLVPQTQGVYTYVFEFFGWRRPGVYDVPGGTLITPPSWYSADDEYGIWTEPTTAGLLSLIL